MKNKFIVIEGGEGSGKTTLIRQLKERYKEDVIVTREPGGTPFAEAIRMVALNDPLAAQASQETLFCLMFAARFDHVLHQIVPDLALRPVISDRFDMSSYAYQVHAEGMHDTLEKTFWNLREALGIVPDLYIFLDVDPVEGLRRRKEAKGGNHLDDRPLEFHSKVREGFLRFLDYVPHKVIIDANAPLEKVEREFFAVLKKELG